MIGLGTNVGLTQVNTVVQQNASASEELKSQVNQLLRMTEGIEITEDIGEDVSPQAENTVAEPQVIKPVRQIAPPAQLESAELSFLPMESRKSLRKINLLHHVWQP
jgi:hypothetical protein